MIRKQIYIDEDLDRGLKRLAAQSGRPEAHYVRAALEIYLQGHLPAPEQDPLDRLVGLVADEAGPDDVAANHDRYLYDVR